MVEVEFIQDYKCCWKKGDRREVQDHFAYVLIEQGIAKKIERQDKKSEAFWEERKKARIILDSKRSIASLSEKIEIMEKLRADAIFLKKGK